MKAVLMAAATAFAMGLANAEYLVSDTDLGTLESPGVSSYYLHQAGPGTTTFTLSQDATQPAITTYPDSGREILCDFADGGGHTLTLSGGLMSKVSGGSGTIRYLGGRWNLDGHSMYLSGNEEFLSGLDVIADGVVFTNVATCFINRISAGGTISLTNGAAVAVSGANLYLFYPWTNADSFFGGNSTLSVSSGSRLSGDGDVFFDWLDVAKTVDDCGIRAVFTGEGTALQAGSRIVYGAWLGGTKSLFEKGATAVSDKFLVGLNAAADDIRVTVAEEAVVHAETSVEIGAADGSDGHRLEILDGAMLETVQAGVDGYGIVIGKKSSHNELVVSNATLSGRLTIGYGPEANHNVCRIKGAAPTLDLKNSSPVDPFGEGSDNALVFDGVGPLVLNEPLKIVGKGNSNALRFENGSDVSGGLSVCSMYYDIVTAASVGAELDIVGDSTFTLTGQFFLSGQDNTVVLSNGTLKAYTGSPYAFYFGYDSSNLTVPSSGNRLVLRGSRPQLTSDQDAPQINFMNGSIIRFELPAEGYETVPISGAVSIAAGCAIEIADIEALQHAQEPKYKEYVLIESRDGAPLAIDQSIVNAASETLPAGCELRHAGNAIVLKVKAVRDRGLLLLMR